MAEYPMDKIHPEGQNLQRLTIDLDGRRLSKGIPPVVENVWKENVEELEKEIGQNPHIVNREQSFGDGLIHIATKAKKLRSLQTLLKNGAEVSLLNKDGETALYTAVSEKWQEGIIELLQHGASPDKFSEPKTPTLEAPTQTALHNAINRGDNKSTALLLRKSPDLSLCDGLNQTVLHMAAKAHSMKILTRLLHEPSCQKIIEKNDSMGNSILHAAIHNNNIEEGQEDEVQNKIIKIVQLIIDNGINVNSTNSFGITPVYLAAQKNLPKVARILINLDADLSLQSYSNNSVLHAACESGSNDCLQIFLETGKVENLILAQNNNGKDPFSLAIDSSSTFCCEILLSNGDHLGQTDSKGRTRCSVILEKMPKAFDLLTRVFDKHIAVSSMSKGDPKFNIEFDYSPIFRKQTEELQCSIIPKLCVPQFRQILKHPLIESYLVLKWNRLKFLFYWYVLLYFSFLIVHSAYIFYTFGPTDKNWRGDSKRLYTVRLIHVILYIFFLIPGTGMVLTNRHFFKERETYYILFSVLASAFVVFSPNTCDCFGGSRSVLLERPIAALSAVFSWGEFSLLLGKFPKLGKYISMLSHVAESMVKVTAGFSSLLIGFAICFSVMYNDQNVFSTLTHSMVKILMMMIGEYNYVVMPDSEDMAKGSKDYIVYFGSILLIFFLLIVSVLMTNLFIGVAVDDIGKVLQYGKVERLYKQAQYIKSFENLLKYAYEHKWKKMVSILTKIGSINKKTIIHPNNYDRFPLRVPKDAIEASIQIIETENGKEDILQYNEETDIAMFMKNFRAFFVADLHKQNKQREAEDKQHKFILERLVNLENMLESHSSKSI